MDTRSATVKLETLTLTTPETNSTILPPPFINSITELRNISTALSTFLQHYDDLHDHIKFVNSSIDEKLLTHLGTSVNFNDFALTPLVISNDVLEGSRNPKETVSDCERPNDSDNDVLEGSRNVKEVVSACERSDYCGDNDDVLDGSGRRSDDMHVNVSQGVVLERNISRSVSECERMSDENVSMHVEGSSVLGRNVNGNVSDCERSDCGGDDVLEGSVLGRISESECVWSDDDDDVRMHASSNCMCDVTKASECERGAENVMLCESPNYMKEDEIVVSDCDDAVSDVQKGVVLVGKDGGNESECERRGKDVKMCERSGSGDESDGEHVVNDVVEGSVLGQNANGSESECEWSLKYSKNDEEVGVLKSCEEIDSNDLVSDVLEGVVLERNANITKSECEGIHEDVLKKHEGTDFDHVVTDVREDVVLEQKTDGNGSECEQSEEDVRMDESANDLKTFEETDALKNAGPTYYDRLIAELLEDIVKIEQNSNETASKCDRKYENARKPQSPDSLMNSEEMEEPEEADDALKTSEEIDEPEEAEALKDSKGSDYDRIITDLLEDVVIEQKSNGTASNSDVSKKSEEYDVLEKPEKTDSSKKPENVENLKSPKPPVSKLERLCKSMGGREMKKHIVKNISEMDKIRIELPKALKLAVNPARVVLDSIGTYFLQSGKPSRRSSHQNLNDENEARRASVLILECFVMIRSDGVEISREDEAYALETSVQWKNRVNREGGMRHMEEADARGLLLFISGFGISDRVFSSVDIMDLIRASNVKGISNALRRSFILIQKIPEVIDMMMMRNLEIEAAEIAYTFGLVNKCHPKGTITNPDETDVSKTPKESGILKNPEETYVSKNPEEIDALKKPEEIDILLIPERIFKNPEETHAANEPEETDGSKKPEKVGILKNPKPAVSELEGLCKIMGGREMKKYIVKNISDMNKLRIDIPKALKLAVNPARVVLDSIGTYLLQSGKAYHSGPYQNLNDQVEGRKTSVLILECFVMISSDGIEISREDEVYALEAAVLWNNRVIREGGLRHMEEADARSLLLFVSGFGITDRIFNIVDIMNLIMCSNVKGISYALRRSVSFITKIPEVISLMVKNNLEVEAADLAYTFGLEYKCHTETILMTFLHNKIKDNQNGSSFQGLAAIKKQLYDLKSVKKCLKSHNIDPSKLLSDFKINEKIQHLEKELNEQDQMQKRKAIDTESLENPNHQEAKRTCFSHQAVPNGTNPYNWPTHPSSTYSDRNLPNNYISTYSSSSVFNASSLPGNITSSAASGTNVYCGGNMWPHGRYGDPSLVEKYLGQPYMRQSQTYNSQPSLTGLYGRPPDRYSFADTAHMSGHPGFPGSSPSGGFAARRGPVLDLYSFADVVDKESRSSRAVGTGGMRSSKLY